MSTAQLWEPTYLDFFIYYFIYACKKPSYVGYMSRTVTAAHVYTVFTLVV